MRKSMARDPSAPIWWQFAHLTKFFSTCTFNSKAVQGNNILACCLKERRWTRARLLGTSCHWIDQAIRKVVRIAKSNVQVNPEGCNTRQNSLHPGKPLVLHKKSPTLIFFLPSELRMAATDHKGNVYKVDLGVLTLNTKITWVRGRRRRQKSYEIAAGTVSGPYFTLAMKIFTTGFVHEVLNCCKITQPLSNTSHSFMTIYS